MHRAHSELTIKPIEAHSGTSKFDLTLFMVEEENHISGALEYNTALFDDSTIGRMLEHFDNIIQSIVYKPDQPIAQLKMVSDSEKSTMLAKLAGETKIPTLDKTIIEIFEHQVEKNPHNIAVDFEDKQLSYEQLNKKVNQLAHHLIEQGVGLDTLVGIFIKRSFDMIISMLAVLKAGGAYVQAIQILNSTQKT